MIESVGMISGIFAVVIAIFSIILHEVAHGYAAYIQGDETAYRAGRLTLNPLPHLDVFGSVIIPLLAFFGGGLIFGWAKPVPYNPYNIRTRTGQAFVAAAGILTNLFIACIAGIIFATAGITDGAILSVLFTIIIINVSLAFFNLIPVPPFDGMSIIQALFPRIRIRSDIVHNPLYMIGAIIFASVLYSLFMPTVFRAVLSLIS